MSHNCQNAGSVGTFQPVERLFMMRTNIRITIIDVVVSTHGALSALKSSGRLQFTYWPDGGGHEKGFMTLRFSADKRAVL